MKKLYDLIVMCWQFGKNLYEHPVKNQDDWIQAQAVRKKICEQFEDPRENTFVRAMTSAIMDYYESEKHEY